MSLFAALTSVILSFSGWWRHQRWRLHLQLLPVLEGPLTRTWPFTARRCQRPFPNNKRQDKSQRFVFWCHGNLKMIDRCSDQQQASIMMKMWCFSADRLDEMHPGEMQQPDVADCQPCQSDKGCSKWAACWCKISVRSMRYTLQQYCSCYRGDPLLLKVAHPSLNSR